MAAGAVTRQDEVPRAVVHSAFELLAMLHGLGFTRVSSSTRRHRPNDRAPLLTQLQGVGALERSPDA
jgi:hypothetical protein